MTTKDRKELYRAFAQWRLQLQDANKGRKSVLFFRRSFDHSIIWMKVMYGWYSDDPPSISECIHATHCSPDTARKLISDGERLGFLLLKMTRADRRTKLVHPTRQTQTEFEAMVRGYTSLQKTLGLPFV